MSLLRKIRRRNKVFDSKKSTQIKNIVDGAASVSSVEDGEDGDEDDDAVVNTGQADVQNVHAIATVSSILENLSAKDSAEQGDLSGQYLNFEPSYDTQIAGEDVTGTESRFWPWIAKSATLLLLCTGAFYIGKVATVAITLCLLLACKLSARGRMLRSESSNPTEFRQADQCDKQSISQEVIYHDSGKVDEFPYRSSFVNNDNSGAEIGMEVNRYGNDGETFSTTADENCSLTKRKQLKRLNCIKLPPSASPFGEITEESPLSAKASPRTWFRNAGNSMVAGSNTVETSAEFRKQVKFKSKALFGRLRKGEPHSDSEATNGFSIVSDGSDSEKGILNSPATHRKSKFMPISPVANADASNMRLLNLATRNGEKQQTPPLSDACRLITEDGKADGVFCKANIKGQNVSPLLPKEKQSACIPPTTSSGDDMTKLELPAFVITTRELPRRRGGRHPSSRNPVAVSVVQEHTARRHTTLANTDISLSGAAILKRGERKQQKVRVGTAWLTSGLVIITAGLLMGRIVAVASLVCYWYALSLVKKRAKASEDR